MSDVEPGDEIVVKYGVKELLAIQGKTLERIEIKVDANALSQAEAIGKLDTRVSLLEARPDLEPRVTLLEQGSFESNGRRDYSRFILPIALTVIYTALSLLSTIHKW